MCRGRHLPVAALAGMLGLFSVAASPGGAQAGNPTVEELSLVSQRLAVSRQREKALSRELATLDRDFERITQRLSVLAEDIQSRESMIDIGRTSLASIARQERELSDALANRRDDMALVFAGVRRMTQHEPPVLFASPDRALASVRGARLFETVILALKTKAAALSQDLARLQNLRQRHARIQEQLQADIAALRQSRAETEQLRRKKAALIGRSKSERDRETLLTEKLTDKLRALQQMLTALVRDGEQSQRQSQRRRDWLSRDNGGSGFSQLRGLLRFPASGRPLRQFDEKDGAGGRSKGLYLLTRTGAKVVAPTDARVAFAGPFRSYGQVLILDLGEGYHMLLAGLAHVSVEKEYLVKAGETLGRMGQGQALGLLTGTRSPDAEPVLYIELRRDGAAVDSRPWWIAGHKEARR